MFQLHPIYGHFRMPVSQADWLKNESEVGKTDYDTVAEKQT